MSNYDAHDELSTLSIYRENLRVKRSIHKFPFHTERIVFIYKYYIFVLYTLCFLFFFNLSNLQYPLWHSFHLSTRKPPLCRLMYRENSDTLFIADSTAEFKDQEWRCQIYTRRTISLTFLLSTRKHIVFIRRESWTDLKFKLFSYLKWTAFSFPRAYAHH